MTVTKGILPAATALFVFVELTDLAHLWATDTALLVGAVALRILFGAAIGVCLILSFTQT